jgi:spermidine synthase
VLLRQPGNAPIIADMERTSTRPAAASVAPYAFLFLSGAAALACEVVWVRMLADVFGTTAGATAVVLACFMGGMGAGALVLGRIADRTSNGVRLYAFLEIAAGALACLVPLLVWLSGFVYGWVFRAVGAGDPGWFTLTRALLSALALGPPAFMLGGTLPALVRSIARRRDELGASIGRLYAANTAGAVVGCFVTGYVLVPVLGVLGTVFLAAGVSIAVGGAAFALSRATKSPVTLDSATPVTGAGDDALAVPPLRRWAMPALYGASGLAAMGCEVLWTRALVFLLRSTVYAFTSMLTVFLVGLAAGGAIGARVARSAKRPALWFACVEVGVAVSVTLSLVTLRAFAADWVSVDLALGSGWTLSTLLHLLIAAAVMLVPTVLLGMAFPLAGRLHAPVAPPGRATGELLLGNTLGGVVGSLAAGFVLAPLAGTAYSILGLAGVGLFVAAGTVALLAKAPYGIKLRAVVGAGLVTIAALVMAPPEALGGLFAAPNPKAELIYVREDASGTVTVHRYEETGHLALSAGGVPVAGTAPPLRSTQVLQALIPTLLHPAPERILQVGLGSGETARIALDRAGSSDRASYTAVEISPAVVRAARKFFEPVNQGVLDDPRFSLTIADGANFARHARARFDIVLTESTYPFLSGSSGLYTLDYFRDVRRLLAQDGTVSCWLPLDVPERGLKSLLRTFAEAFPHATLWTTSGYAYKHALLLGSDSPSALKIEYSRLKKRFAEPEVARLLIAAGVDSPEEFVAGLMLNRDGMLAYAGDAPLHTRNRPVLEYQTALRSAQNWRQRLAANFEELDGHRVDPVKYVVLSDLALPEQVMARTSELDPAVCSASAATKLLVERLKREGDAFPFLARARAARKEGDTPRAIELYRRALDTAPDWREVSEELGLLYLEMGMTEEARKLAPD